MDEEAIMSRLRNTINIGVAREVVRRFRELYPSVTVSDHLQLWLEAEIRRGEKELERAARGDAYWPEVAPAQAVARDPSPTFAD
jgi:hypothetical protein